MTPPAHPYDRRRAEDVFRVVEDEVFPRLGAIDTKITSLEQGMSRLTVEGCAHRAGDLRRTEGVEDQMVRIFEKIDCIGDTLTTHQLDMVEKFGGLKTNMEKQVGGIRVWVLTGCVVILVAMLSFMVSDFMGTLVRKAATAIIAP